MSILAWLLDGNPHEKTFRLPIPIKTFALSLEQYAADRNWKQKRKKVNLDKTDFTNSIIDYVYVTKLTEGTCTIHISLKAIGGTTQTCIKSNTWKHRPRLDPNINQRHIDRLKSYFDVIAYKHNLEKKPASVGRR